MRSSMKLMVRGAMMIALATVLSLFEVFRAPFGGSVTLGSMVPIVLFALLYDLKWGSLTALAYGVLQLLLGTGNLSGLSLEAVFGAMLLDYIVAFAVLGLTGCIARRFKNRFVGAGVGTFVVMLLRFGCHFLFHRESSTSQLLQLVLTDPISMKTRQKYTSPIFQYV